MKAIGISTRACCCAGSRCCVAGSRAAAAQDWPSRNVTVVVPFRAGVASDIIARVVFEQVGKQVGQTFVIENRAGAGGTIGANIGRQGRAGRPHHPGLWLDCRRERAVFEAALRHGRGFHAGGAVRPDAAGGGHRRGRYKTLAELVAAAKAKPGALNYSTVGVGSAAHFGAERLAVSAGFTAQHIPFKGGEWLTEIIAGRHRLQRAAGDHGDRRHPRRQARPARGQRGTSASRRCPNVPTMIEAGLTADAIYPFYTGAYLPAKTPRAIVEKLHDEVMKALALPAVQERLVKLGVEPMPMTVAEFGDFFKKDIAANLALVKAAKIPVQ